MTGLRDIQEPPCPFDEEAFQGCLTFVGDRLTYYINGRCRANLLWLFWFNYAESPIGADADLDNDFYEALANWGDWIPFSQTVVIPTKDKKLRDKCFPTGYKQVKLVEKVYSAREIQTRERLDFYVTKSEFAKAYRVIRLLGRRRKGVVVREGQIFGCVRVVLLDDAEFGEKS